MEWINGEFKINDDKSLIVVDKVCELISKSYWAPLRPREITELSIKNSICYGVYHNSEQIGYARVVTDFATMFWLCDVIIDESHRGRGLGKMLVKCIVESDDLKGKLGILVTRDAHELYAKHGFIRDAQSFMRMPRK